MFEFVSFPKIKLKVSVNTYLTRVLSNEIHLVTAHNPLNSFSQKVLFKVYNCNYDYLIFHCSKDASPQGGIIIKTDFNLIFHAV